MAVCFYVFFTPCLAAVFISTGLNTRGVRRRWAVFWFVKAVFVLFLGHFNYNQHKFMGGFCRVRLVLCLLAAAHVRLHTLMLAWRINREIPLN